MVIFQSRLTDKDKCYKKAVHRSPGTYLTVQLGDRAVLPFISLNGFPYLNREGEGKKERKKERKKEGKH